MPLYRHTFAVQKFWNNLSICQMLNIFQTELTACNTTNFVQKLILMCQTILNRKSGAVLIKLFESEIDFNLRHFPSPSISKAYKIWHMCGLEACSGSRCQNLTYLELEHELDLKLKKFYKHRSRPHISFSVISWIVFKGHLIWLLFRNENQTSSV